jgi:hypothetical protein
VKTARTTGLLGYILTHNRCVTVCHLRGTCGQSDQRPLHAEGKDHDQSNELELHEFKDNPCYPPGQTV